MSGRLLVWSGLALPRWVAFRRKNLVTQVLVQLGRFFLSLGCWFVCRFAWSLGLGLVLVVYLFVLSWCFLCFVCICLVCVPVLSPSLALLLPWFPSLSLSACDYCLLACCCCVFRFQREFANLHGKVSLPYFILRSCELAS